MVVEAPRHSVRRSAILDAALECFTEKGFTPTTIDDVRRRSGASIGSIYHHFKSKEQLAAALYVEGLRRYGEGFVATLRGHPSAERGVKALVRHHLRWVAGNPDLARFLLASREAEVAEQSESGVRDLNRELFAATADWLEPHVRSGALRGLPSDLFYPLLVGPSQEFARHWLAGRVETPIRAAEPVLADAAWRALRGGDEDRRGRSPARLDPRERRRGSLRPPS